jgi:hypothetical protein
MDELHQHRVKKLRIKIIRLEGELQHKDRLIEGLKGDIERLSNIITAHGVPDYVKDWMVQFELYGIELFKCPEHNEWITELDSSFPYHWEGNRCDSCD